MELPEITEAERLTLRPGDALIVHIADRELDMHTAHMVQERVRAALKLPDDFPVMVLGQSQSVEVVEHGPR